MYPTVKKGAIITLNRDISTINRGDIIIHNEAMSDEIIAMIRRVIALPEDTIMIQNGNVYINGQQLDESAYLPSGTQTYGGTFLQDGVTYKVHPGGYAVMGDNRQASYDSRENGFVWGNVIIGKVILN